MAEHAPRKSYLIVVLVILAVLVVVIAKVATRHTTPAESQLARSPAESPVAQTAAAVPPDSTRLGAPDSAPEAPSPDTPVSSGPASPAGPAKPASDDGASAPSPGAQPEQAKKKPVELIPGSKLAECLTNGRPTLVDFGAGWCKPCQQQDPILRQTASTYEGRANVVFVDTDKYPEIARQYRVASIPAQFVFDAEGTEVAKHIGLWPAEEIDKALASAGVGK